jgi:hypothetical protein
MFSQTVNCARAMLKAKERPWSSTKQGYTGQLHPKRSPFGHRNRAPCHMHHAGRAAPVTK